MKKDLGSVLGLYPMPLAIIGAMVEGKPNWLLAGHLGIMGHDHIMVSLAKAHYTNQGIRESGVLSVSLVDEALLERADTAGCISGSQADKSLLFSWEKGEENVPIPKDAKLTMECQVEDIYETPGFENFILTIRHTYVEERILDEDGTIEYDSFRPILFEMPKYTYLKTGQRIGKCRSFGKKGEENE